MIDSWLKIPTGYENGATKEPLYNYINILQISHVTVNTSVIIDTSFGCTIHMLNGETIEINTKSYDKIIRAIKNKQQKLFHELKK